METVELLKTAWQSVLDAELPESIQPKAFELAVHALAAARQTSGTALNLDTEGEAQTQSASPATPLVDKAQLTDPLAKLAHEAGVEVDDLEEVLHFDNNGDPHVHGPARKLGKTKAAQARTVAVLITAARSFALDETAVESKVVRAECVSLKCMDSKNFATQTTTIPGLTTIGNGQSRTFKLKSGDAGLTKFREAVSTVRGVKADS